MLLGDITYMGITECIVSKTWNQHFEKDATTEVNPHFSSTILPYWAKPPWVGVVSCCGSKGRITPIFMAGADLEVGWVGARYVTAASTLIIEIRSDSIIDACVTSSFVELYWKKETLLRCRFTLYVGMPRKERGWVNCLRQGKFKYHQNVKIIPDLWSHGSLRRLHTQLLYFTHIDWRWSSAQALNLLTGCSSRWRRGWWTLCDYRLDATFEGLPDNNKTCILAHERCLN